MSEHVERWRLRAAEWLEAQQAADLLRETKNDVFAEIKSHMAGKSEAARWKPVEDDLERIRKGLAKAGEDFRRKLADQKLDGYVKSHFREATIDSVTVTQDKEAF